MGSIRACSLKKVKKMEKEEQKKPTKPKSDIGKDAEMILDYLRKHGAASPIRVAKDLNLEPLTVLKTVEVLERQDKVRLYGSSREHILRHRVRRPMFIKRDSWPPLETRRMV